MGFETGDWSTVKMPKEHLRPERHILISSLLLALLIVLLALLLVVPLALLVVLIVGSILRTPYKARFRN
jgi:uncharacterized membrane protein YqjE